MFEGHLHSFAERHKHRYGKWKFQMIRDKKHFSTPHLSGGSSSGQEWLVFRDKIDS